jgi:hypothetical protein
VVNKYARAILLDTDLPGHLPGPTLSERYIGAF